MTDPQPTPQLVDNHSRSCPTCGAGPGDLCLSTTGGPMPVLTHRARPKPRKARKLAARGKATPARGPAMSEAELGREVAKLAKRGGARVMHVRRSRSGDRWETATSIPGWVDLVIWGPCGVLFRELKGTGGVVSAKQAEVIAQLNAAGGDAAVWTPVDLASGLIEATLCPATGDSVGGPGPLEDGPGPSQT